MNAKKYTYEGGKKFYVVHSRGEMQYRPIVIKGEALWASSQIMVARCLSKGELEHLYRAVGGYRVDIDVPPEGYDGIVVRAKIRVRDYSLAHEVLTQIENTGAACCVAA